MKLLDPIKLSKAFLIAFSELPCFQMGSKVVVFLKIQIILVSIRFNAKLTCHKEVCFVNNLIVLSNPNLPWSVEASQRRIIFTPEYVYKSREALLSSVVLR